MAIRLAHPRPRRHQKIFRTMKDAPAITYPKTKKVDQKDNYHGTEVADPYRWLENDTAADVKKWVTDQNKIADAYLSNIPYHSTIKKRLTEIWDYPKYSTPDKHGEYIFFYKNEGLQNQMVLYYQKGENGTPEVFIDPNKFSDDGTMALTGFSVSKDHTYAAYGTSQSGSDWNEIHVMEVATKKKLKDKIKWVKFSGATWYKNGFFYSRYDQPAKDKEFSNQNQFMKIYYHELGKPQKDDKILYQDKQHPLRYFNAQVTEDDRYLIVNVSEGTTGTELLFKDLSKNEKGFRVLAKGFKNNHTVINNNGDKIFMLTDLNAPRYRLVEIDPAHNDPASWKDLIPQSDDLLESVSTGGGKLFATYLKDASSRIYQHDYTGKRELEIKLPGLGTASGFGSKKNEKTFYYSFVSFTTPGIIFKYSISNGKSELFRQSEVKFDTSAFETKQVFYTSKDGTKIPMFIIHKKGLKLDGNNPTMLYGYGGFNISLTPSFSISRILFLEQGGVYAMANLRGGGEYGEDWHKAGMFEKKQNVFDDFISAAQYLISEKYTSSNKLAINGGSNGGLLVGACITQRPDLYRVAVATVGVLDMLRYHKFTIGWGWVVEYGSSDTAKDFKYLYKYSPLHNVKDASYPATMICTADHDDRVVPAHSFKFLATLQEKHTGSNPIIGRIDTKAGHGAGKPTAKVIDEVTDVWSFVLWNLGLDQLVD
jgi:prolyl oligopeptidase